MNKIVTIDSHEPKSIRHLLTTYFVRLGYDVDVKVLNVGDIESSSTIVERKTIIDFVNSMIREEVKDGIRTCRLDRQLVNLSYVADTFCKVPVLLIHGYYFEVLDLENLLGINNLHDMIHGAIASCICRYGVITLWIEDTEDAIEVLTKLVAKIDEGKYLRPRRSIDKVALLSRLLELPVKKTKKLLKHCGGSISSIVNSDPSEYVKVKGIGVKTAKKIRQLLDEELV